MIDPASYNAAEKLGALNHSWQYRASHYPQVLKESGFPVSVESLQDLYPLLDCMQEGRFEAYQQELGGLTDGDIERIEGALIDLVKMQRIHFPGRNPVKPIDALMSAFVAMQKVRAARPFVNSILEIGPGCGYAALFSPVVQIYTQIESCQSFYLLQAMVNARHGPFVWEAALSERPKDDEATWHIPWWGIGYPENNGGLLYDVIMANACLCEMTDAAFNEYRKLFLSVSDDKTPLLIQCPGAPRFRDQHAMVKALTQDGWRGIGKSGAVNTFWLTRGNDEIKTLMPEVGAKIRTREELCGLAR